MDELDNGISQVRAAEGAFLFAALRITPITTPQ